MRAPRAVSPILALTLLGCAPPAQQAPDRRPQAVVADEDRSNAAARPRPSPGAQDDFAASRVRGADGRAGVQPSPAAVISLPGGIEVDRAIGEVRVPAIVACTVGWLEQVACREGTREHESLLVVECKPSDVHAALLLLDLMPGAPGTWSYDGHEVEVRAPHGDGVAPFVRYEVDGAALERPVAEWIRGADGRAFPSEWVFAGSRFVPNPKSWGPGEHYAADESGSLVGLVTFGDETVGARTVIPDQLAVESANWESWTERMPKEGTRATLVLRRVD